MEYSAAKIAQIVQGQMVGNDGDQILHHLSFDSRTLHGEVSHTLFVALKTAYNDGHMYLEEAASKGVCVFLIDQEIKTLNDQCCYLKVSNVLRAIQQLAQHHRKLLDHPIIGITGSNAKTIIKEWIATLLERRFKIGKSPRSYNSQLGVAVSILNVDTKSDLSIFEAGISEKGEMTRLEEMITPNIGVFTNIGSAHDAGFDNRDEKISEKLLLFKSSKKLVLSADHKAIFEKAQATLKHTELCSWSIKNNKAKYQGKREDNQLYIDQSIFKLGSKFRSDHELENLIHSIVLVKELGLGDQEIQDRLPMLEGIALRLEIKEGINNNTIIDDSYVLDLDSLRVALDYAQTYAHHQGLVLILSDFDQSSLSNEKYIKLATLINKVNPEAILSVGKEIGQLKDFLTKTIKFAVFDTKEKLLGKLKTNPLIQKTILIKAARRFQFERISNFLSKKTHQAFLEVNLEALHHNIDFFKSKLTPETEIIAVVKADAYGTGSEYISQMIQNKVDQFAVAYIDEGVALRKVGITKPIIVLNPEISGFDKLVQYGLEPEIYQLEQLEIFAKYVAFQNRAYPIHLKINTGMNRLGFHPKNFSRLKEMLDKYSIKVKSIFTHLAAAEDQEEDNFSLEQLKIFEKAYKDISEYLDYKSSRHVLNSSGILRFPSFHYEAVRLGIGMYGGGSPELGLKKVHVLKASISQINEVSKGESIGYGHKIILDRPKTIAIINIGYADGLLRALGNGKAHFYINGYVVPTIGHICMDMCMIDISATKDLKAGMEIEIFGVNIHIEDHAKAANTISYEILSRLSSRIKKIYIKE